jgi:signal transduction histidine kinase
VRLSIFSRLVVGFCALLILVTGTSLYTVAQLSRVRHVTRSIVSADNKLFDIQKKLGDILLSEIRYEQKFLIMKNTELFNGFFLASGDFEKNLDEGALYSDSAAVKDLLSRIKQFHERYKSLFNQQVEYLKAGNKSSDQHYADEMKRMTDGIMGELEQLRALNQKNIFTKIKDLDEAQTSSARFALVMTAASLLFGIILSVFITRSITTPISEMKKKTRDIASGIFEDNLNLTSPPEIGELASAFNSMVGSLADARNQLKGREQELYEANARLTQEIAEVKRAKEELRQLAAELERSNTDLQQFAYVASHDLQQPLQVIAGFIELLAKRSKGKLDERANEYIASTIDGVNRMSTLIKGLLEYARVDTQGKTFENTDCASSLGEALSILKKVVEESGARVTYDSLPTLKADAVQLTSLFQNLIGNAIKFRGDSPPEIHVSAVRKGDEQVFSVRDNGIGIDQNSAGKIFEVFKRLPTRKEYEGSGIGLAICKKIVERHGGRIWVESEPAKGSTFYFTIPDKL